MLYSMTAFATSPILLTGMSGAGLSTAARVLEDKGFYVAHNLPPELMVQLFDLCADDNSPVDKVAVVADVRSRMFGGSILSAMDELKNRNMPVTVLFMDARDDVLIRRFDSVRRTHPLQEKDTLQVGIERERAAISALKERADVIIDSSNLSVHDLRRAMEASFGSTGLDKQHVTVESFGFKHGHHGMRIWSSMCDFCLIRIGFRNCENTAAPMGQ